MAPHPGKRGEERAEGVLYMVWSISGVFGSTPKVSRIQVGTVVTFRRAAQRNRLEATMTSYSGARPELLFYGLVNIPKL